MWLLDTNALIQCHKISGKKPFKKKVTYTTIFSLIEYPLAATHRELSIFYPNALIFKNGLSYALKLREKGTAIPTIDILNGTIAVDKNICLVTDDAHFEVFKTIEPHFKFISTQTFIEEIKTIV